MMKKKEQPVFVLEESEIKVSPEASKNLEKFKEQNPNMTLNPAMEEFFFKVFDLAKDYYDEQQTKAIEKLESNFRDEKYQIARGNDKETHELRNEISSLKSLITEYHKGHLSVVKQAKTDIFDLIKTNNNLKKQISDMQSQDNPGQIVYEYSYMPNMKASEFEKATAEMWEPVQLLAVGDKVNALFKRPLTAIVENANQNTETEEINLPDTYSYLDSSNILPKTENSWELDASIRSYICKRAEPFSPFGW